MGNKLLMELNNVSFSFGENRLFERVNLQIFRGEVFVLVGAGGQGLSTFLKLISGMLTPLEGAVKAFNIDIHRSSRKQLRKLRKAMGYVFQNGALLNNLTLADNIALPLRYHTNLSENSIFNLVKEKLNFVGIKGCERSLPAQLSEEYKKRGGLARALAMKPKLLYYDEPTTGLDEEQSLSILKLFNEIKEKEGITSVVVSNNPSLAKKIADRWAVLENGKINVRN